MSRYKKKGMVWLEDVKCWQKDGIVYTPFRIMAVTVKYHKGLISREMYDEEVAYHEKDGVYQWSKYGRQERM